MTAHARSLPRKRGLMLRLLVLFLAVALAVGLQAGEGQAAGHHDSGPASHPAAREPDCASPVAFTHPALPGLAQPREARSSEANSGCSRPARSGW
ncbi:hypothetical protein GCM10011521_05540 [Arenimonas soli]|uniref:Secreted protein n=1 Tax=Arenimonas soli TaxID=2269504 RepID=A0ABQ1HD77_9GAMM|nr:hypothetical protein [Arenimonas soli]GGA70291.1 hypothetical protein GCM10011521_05540 [Arenimonas soli]